MYVYVYVYVPSYIQFFAQWYAYTHVISLQSIIHLHNISIAQLYHELI